MSHDLSLLGLALDGLHPVRSSMALSLSLCEPLSISSQCFHPRDGRPRASRFTARDPSTTTGPGFSTGLQSTPLVVWRMKKYSFQPDLTSPSSADLPPGPGFGTCLKSCTIIGYIFFSQLSLQMLSSTFFKASCCLTGPSWPSAYPAHIHT